MKYRFFSLAAVVLTLTLSCGKEELPGGSTDNPATGETDKPEVLPSLNEGEIAFSASGEFFYDEDSDETDGIMSSFEDGMKASVFTVGYNNPVEVQAVNTQTNAYFVATAEASKTYYAVYPSSVTHHFESEEHGMSINVTIPQEQDGSLSAASISVASSTGKDARLDFRNICSLLKFSTTSQNIKSVTFRGADNEDLIGTLSVSGFDPETGEPIFGAISDSFKEAKLNVEGRKGVFYVALLPGLTLEKGFLASFEMMPQANELEEASSGYSMTLTRSCFRDLGNIVDYIPQLNWFVTEAGGAQLQDGKSWETAISGEQMFQMLACNRPEESGYGNTSTDITTTANKEDFADYLKIHNTKHVRQLDGVTFHIAQGEYSSANYVRVSFPELERQVSFTLRGGYNPQSVGRDLTSRNITQYPTVFKAPSGSGTARMFFLQRWLDMTIDGLTFIGGKGDASIGGGAILLNESSTSSILFKDCTFTKNISSSFGGAVNASNEVGQISFVGCVFSENRAVKSGGAIHTTSGIWNFIDCTFLKNTGTDNDSYGGALYAKNSSLTCTGCTFSENTSINNGGAVWMNAMTKADFINCDFTSNESTENLAGAICLSGANPLNITGGTFRSNKAAAGGGCIYNNAPSIINITGTKFIENQSTSKGGGVFYCNETEGPLITVSAAEFTANSTLGFGGAIYCLAGTWNFTNTIFSKNTGTEKDSYGGALYAKNVSLACTGCTFSENTSKNNGGAVWMNAMIKADFINCDFISNECTANLAGAICLSGANPLNITGGAFKGNTASQGGCIYNNAASNINISGTKFINNVASTGVGGVIYCNENDDPIISIAKVEFTSNEAAGAGGALYCKAGKWNITGTTFDGNIAGNHGGALHSTGSKAVFVIDGSIIRNNSVTGSAAGGAIYSNTTTTGNTVSNTKFESNSTLTNGGALYWSGSGALALDKCNFEGNNAKTQGAVIKKTAGTLYCNASSFTSNVAKGERTGGVMRIEGGNTFISNCCFYGNTAPQAHTDLVLCGGTTTVLNSTLFESDKTMACIRVYNAAAVANLYNNVLLNPNTASNEGTVRVGHWGNPGSITSPGYNYTTQWKLLVDPGITGSITMADTDKVVAYTGVSGNFTSASTTDGRGYYTWTKPADVTVTTAANLTAFLNGITEGSDFVSWLNTVGGLTKDIAGNNRPETGWYPGCYQGN